MEIKIAVLVGSNGRWHCVPYEGEETDWSFCDECVGYDSQKGVHAPPECEQRLVLHAMVEVPEIEDIDIPDNSIVAAE